MKIDDKIYVAGHTGLVGTALLNALNANGYQNIVIRNRKELDLLDKNGVDFFFQEERPDYVFLVAAKCSGIKNNVSYPVSYIEDNLYIQTNVISSCYKHKCKKLIFVGSAATYPKNSKQPMIEDWLLDGKLDESNEFYSIAKIAGIKLCQAYQKQFDCNFISVQPSNIYGPNDRFNADDSHVVAALIDKFHNGKIQNLSTITCWGSGEARREFIYVDDFANALILIMKKYKSFEPINIGVGKDYSIKDLAETISQTVGYEGKIIWDTSKPEGVKQRLLDSSKLFSLGWNPLYDLRSGLEKTYDFYKKEIQCIGH